MSDLIDRIKGLRYVHVPQASQLFEEAIAEIERLRLQIENMRAVISADHHRPSPVSDREIREFHRRLMAMGGVRGRTWEE